MKRTGPHPVLVLSLVLAPACHAQVDRALAYLSAEVRQWPEQNKCFSCHNNGDGARALYVGKARGRVIDDAALATTNAWLDQPLKWESAGENPGISDKILASIQFAAALAERTPVNRKALAEAGRLLAASQGEDGSWKVDALGSPATYGTALATVVASRTLQLADPQQFKAEIGRATAWLTRQKPANTPDAAGYLLTFPSESKFLLSLQNSDGGWGPWKDSPSEPFDTALAVLALRGNRRGREYLLKTQQPAGGWRETTRPAGGQSYAQHISTTAWAAIALLEPGPELENNPERQ